MFTETSPIQQLPVDPFASPARTLLDVFDATLARTPGATALDAPDARLTYTDLDGASRELAERLALVGIGVGDRVGVRVRSGTAELYVAILAVLRAGAAYVPIDAEDPEARAAHAWEQAGVAAVVEDHQRIAVRGPGAGRMGPPTAGDDAWIIFTSGSTGKPKGVAVTHAAATAFVDAEAGLLRVGPDDRVLAGLSVGFDASCEEIWLAWGNGATLVPAPRWTVRSGSELGAWLQEHAVTVVSTVPSLAAMWDPADLASIRLLVLGGEACPDALGWRLAEGREVWNTYGPTEATVVTTATRVLAGEAVTIGHPLPGWTVAVTDDRGRPVPDGEQGELVIGGVGLGRYLDAALDADRFAAAPHLGWPRAYRTGDVVRMGPDGIEFCGRRDDQVKIGGRRIELDEVGAAVAAVDGVTSCAVVVRRTAAGDPVLAAYTVASRPAVDIRRDLAEHLPAAMVPVVIAMDILPLAPSGKVDRKALPWPPPVEPAALEGATETERWLAGLWREHLGTPPSSRADDFFDLGGTSLAAARVASAIRLRHPSAGVADLYANRTLSALAAHLNRLAPAAPVQPVSTPPVSTARARGGAQLAGVLALIVAGAPSWVIGLLAFDDVVGGRGLPCAPWPVLLVAWVLLVSTPGRLMLTAAARKLLLRDLAPGRYPRRSSLATRVWFVDRLSDVLHVSEHGGTPWASTVARMMGADVAPGARLGTIPSPASLVTIGAGATVEGDVDLHGWWIDGPDLVVGTVTVGEDASIGSRSLLMPGSSIGAGAEVDAGTVVSGDVPAGERWSGSPGRSVGTAGRGWPAGAPPEARQPRLLRLGYGLSQAFASLLPAIAIVGALAVLAACRVDVLDSNGVAVLIPEAPAIAALFVLIYALASAGAIRLLGRWIRPGWHGPGVTLWAAWTAETILAGTRSALFPLYSSSYTRRWLRLMGVTVGRRTEVSTMIGLGALVSLGATSFVADDVVARAGRARGGWVELRPIRLDDGVFVGNGALVNGGTRLESGSLLGVQSTPAEVCGAGTSWFGAPAIEFPRPAAHHDPSRTTSPPRRLVAARRTIDIVRIVVPFAVSAALGELVFGAMQWAGHSGLWLLVAVTPVALLVGGVIAAAVTIAAKWLLMGRYRAGDHPLWSHFVWRDEIMNTCQELLAGAWLLDAALGTPLMGVYLRAMGTEVGRDVWCDTLTITEFDMVTLGDGCAVNRRSCVETHLFQDRVMSIGPNRIGAGATLGPSSALLPDTLLGEGAAVGARSVVLRGEEVPAATRWHGAPLELQAEGPSAPVLVG